VPVARVVAAATAGVLAGWLAVARWPAPSSMVRMAAILCGCLALGCAIVVSWQRGDCEAGNGVRRRAWSALAAAAVAWALTEVVVAQLAAADTVGASAATVTFSDLGDFVHSLPSGQASLLAIVCTFTVSAIALDAARSGQGWPPALAVVLCAGGLIARPVIGHMHRYPAGEILIAVHVLAAAAWLGTLLAATLALRSTSQWATFLPHYTRLAAGSVGLLLLTGVLAAACQLHSLDDLVTTGHGRILAAKSVVLLAALAGALRLRRAWVAPAERGLIDARASRRHATLHAAIIAAGVGLAAVLAVTP
jgi:putative copper resistance protein D